MRSVLVFSVRSTGWQCSALAVFGRRDRKLLLFSFMFSPKSFNNNTLMAAKTEDATWHNENGDCGGIQNTLGYDVCAVAWCLNVCACVWCLCNKIMNDDDDSAPCACSYLHNGTYSSPSIHGSDSRVCCCHYYYYFDTEREIERDGEKNYA